MVEWLQAGGWPAWVVTGVGACAIGASLAYAIRPRLATLVGALVLVALTFAMGLLGTILGLMAAFRAVSTADPSEKASMLAKLAGGSLKRAHQLAASNELLDLREEVLLLLTNTKKGDMMSWVRMSDTLVSRAKTKEQDVYQANVREVLNALASWYRDAWLVKETRADDLLTNGDRIDQLSEFAAGYETDALVSGLDLLENARRSLSYNVNKDLLLENTIVSLSGLQ